MILFELAKFNLLLMEIGIYEQFARDMPVENIEATDRLTTDWLDLLGRVEAQCVGLLKMESVEDHIQTMRSSFEGKRYKFAELAGVNPHMQLAAKAEELERRIREGLARRVFMYVPPDDVRHYNQTELFGADVKTKFPKANKEITEAGNCYATGNNTACVFHLMRAVEMSARAMVRALGAGRYLVNKQGKQIPVELCDWWTLVSALQKGLDDLSAGTGTSKHKKRKFEHYNHAVASFRNFKDAWRNHVSHTRELYLAGQTKDIMDNARQFMQHLAARLRE